MTDAPLIATYRLQLGPALDFAAVARLVPSLAKLGISHLYLSPILEAARGSTHGYDVIDHAKISDVLGGRAGYRSLVEVAHASGLGVIVDIVPNHMSIADPRNRWWWDVLENGPASRAAHYFDVDWDPPESKLKNRVLMPVLGDHRARVLSRGEITVLREHEHFVIAYLEHRFPVSPRAIGLLLDAANQTFPQARLAFLADAYRELPARGVLEPASLARRQRDRGVLEELQRELIETVPEIANAIDAALAKLNRDPVALDAFLDEQNYRLAYWRSADHEVDYRRFFDVSSLVGLRVENEEVFAATHAIYAELVAAQLLDGLRVDHIDGLVAPATYLARLRQLAPTLPIFVEKILAFDESLPNWPVDGTTGYEFMSDLTALFAHPDGEAALTTLQHELVGETRAFAAILAEARLSIARDLFDSELRRLSHALAQLCEHHPDARDYTRHDLRAALLALTATFPNYRSYIDPDDTAPLSPHDRHALDVAVAAARSLAPNIEPLVFDFLDDVLGLRRRGPAEAELVQRFQQLTAAAYAKGVEDTAGYRGTRLVALNEVGGALERFGLSLSEFHARNRRAQQTTPRRLLATSTHDSKRNEEVRARLVLLAEDHAAFAALATRFIAGAERYWHPLPIDKRVTMLLLQTLIGAYPIDVQRLGDYLEKAIREMRLATSWSQPNREYELQVRAVVQGVLGDTLLCDDIHAYVERTAKWARTVSLGWTLLKLTCPGTPDFYQGNERVRYDLVDPDNRRAIDWSARVTIDEASAQKLALIQSTLTYRHAHPRLFTDGDYEPIVATGNAHDSIVAFARHGNGQTAITIVPRWPSRLADVIADNEVPLPPGVFTDLFSGREFRDAVKLTALTHRHPVMLLVTGASP